MVHVGDTVRRRPVTFSAKADEVSCRVIAKSVHSGRVIYVHPKGRFHLVQFGSGQSAVRECFFGVESVQQNEQAGH